MHPRMSAFRIVRMKPRRVLSNVHVGPCECIGGSVEEDFRELQRTLTDSGLEPREWISIWTDEGGEPPEEWKSICCLSVDRAARSPRGLKLTKLSGGLFASSRLDAEQGEEVVHKLYDDLRDWAVSKGYRIGGHPREVYTGDPWKSKAVSSSARLLIPVR